MAGVPVWLCARPESFEFCFRLLCTYTDIFRYLGLGATGYSGIKDNFQLYVGLLPGLPCCSSSKPKTHLVTLKSTHPHRRNKPQIVFHELSLP